jgi:hypothetical protein
VRVLWQGRVNAGRELDALVAEKVMKLHLAEWADEGDWWVTSDPHNPAGNYEDQATFWTQLPCYSTDIGAAWGVVESPACEGGHKFQLVQEHGVWTAVISGIAEADADTAPLAICLAALKAVGA